MSDGEFWDLSFKEFDLLCRRREREEYRSWRRTAGLMCMIYNVHRGRRVRALKVEDILKDPFAKRQNARDMRRFFERLTKEQKGGCHGGKHA